MKIYHGSLEVIERPLILQPNRLLDYGKGFYTTTSERQAKEWVERRMIENNTTCGYVNVYEFNEERLTDLKRLTFSEPTKEWADFVMANRTQKGFIHDYDIVYGPVANDRVYLQFGLYETGAISVETLIRELKTYKLVDQYLFHTEKALTALHFIESIKIEKKYVSDKPKQPPSAFARKNKLAGGISARGLWFYAAGEPSSHLSF